MRLQSSAAIILMLTVAAPGLHPQDRERDAPRGVRLQDLTWAAAAERLQAGAVVLLPVGGAAVQHGLHLPLGTDARLAEFLAGRVMHLSDVIVAPALPYYHSPAFEEYAGSTSISEDTAQRLTTEVIRSVARHGPRRFLVINAGLPELDALTAGARALAHEGILVRHMDLRAYLSPPGAVFLQPGGLHAGEPETSLMLRIAPSLVDMSRAAREFAPSSSPFRLTPERTRPGTHSPSGVWGDATVASGERGQALLELLVAATQRELESLRRASLPPAVRAAPAPAIRAPGRPGPGKERFERRPDECPGADEGEIRRIGVAYSTAWRRLDAEGLAALWAREGDMLHPDGVAEGSAQVIRQNRAYIFSRPEYRNSRHSLDIGPVRCITPDVAVADAKWELRGVTDAAGTAVPPAEGPSTLVVRKINTVWRIEAYRYSITSVQPPPPVVLPRPGPTQRIR